jgi:putative ubiquitin-RnfH superfamily antitoxin RatB of RatAB toxin-antitoxin module
MAATPELLNCTVVYALAGRQSVVALQVAPGTTIGAAIGMALGQHGLARAHPELAPHAHDAQLEGGAHARFAVGVYNRRAQCDALVGEGDRIEIYRPLQIDPKEGRRLRAARRVARDGARNRK